MWQSVKALVFVVLLGLGVSQAWAFSLLGPFATNEGNEWQVPRIGYNIGGDIGGPMNLNEEYRWNLRTLFYGFTPDFLTYFGSRGVVEVEKAIKILNDLPPFSTLNVDDYPLDVERINHRAQVLSLLDLKSMALQTMIEELGLAEPSRFVFTLRHRWIPSPPVTNYHVIKRHFDPVTWHPSSHINGRLWTYISIADGEEISITVNSPVDPLSFGFPVADKLFLEGVYYTGLTRDDVGGLKYMYRRNNLNVENAVTNATAFSGTAGPIPTAPGVGFGGSPYDFPPAFLTNILFTNIVDTNLVVGLPGGGTNFFVTALRPGVNELNFVRVNYDSLLGAFFAPFSQPFNDEFILNGSTRSQTLQRIVVQPDFLFDANDISGPADDDAIPVLRRTNTDGWANNDEINGIEGHAGPGVIQPPVVITFNSVGPAFFNGPFPFNLSEDTGIFIFMWGSFDGSTNPPVLYPQNVFIEDIERQVLGRR